MKKTTKPNATERRRVHRRNILETFALFAVVPKKGGHRLPVHDLSEDGIGFDLDVEGEAIGEFPITSGESLDLRLYLNQSLYLPLKIKVMRIEEKNHIRRIGAMFAEPKSPGHKACIGMLQMIDEILDIAKVDTSFQG